MRRLKIAKQAVKMQSSIMGRAKEEGQYEAAIQIVNTLAKEQGEAEESFHFW
jgi:hypothetical protein